MSPTGILQFTEKLPLELLEKVLAHTSVPDVLRMKQVGRTSDRGRSLQLNFRIPSSDKTATASGKVFVVYL